MAETSFKYELFFELTPDLLCIAGFDGYFKKINSAVPKLLGYTEEELFSRPINDFVHPDDQEITAKVRKELTRSKPLLNFENRYVTKSGEIVWLAWTSQPIESEQVIFAIAKNITHKKKLEAERNSILAELNEANKELKQLTYTTSHDLRSPVNSLLSLLGLIDPEKVNDDDTRQMLRVLRLAGMRLKETTDHYVDVLREKHQGRNAAEEVDLRETLDSVLQSINGLIQMSKAKIEIDFSALQTLSFNKASLESVFLNLLSNSIKYARPDQPILISIRSEKQSGFNRLIFADNGLGFDMENVKDRIFGLQQTFHGYTDSKGLGLYLVYNHITRFGGTISLDSKINEGSTFTISFKAD